MRSAILAGAVLLAAGLVPLAGAAAAAERQSYSVSVRGVPIGRMALGVNENGQSYSASATVNTTGLVGAFVGFRFEGTAQGVLSGARPRPTGYGAVSDNGRRARRVQIAYSGGTPSRVSIDPPRRPAPHNLEPTAQRNTLDPVSAFWWITQPGTLGQICNRSTRVYDGARLTELAVGAPSRAGGEVVCSGRYTRIAGFPPDDDDPKRYDFTVTWRDEGGTLTPLRIVTDTTLGRAVATRTD